MCRNSNLTRYRVKSRKEPRAINAAKSSDCSLARSLRSRFPADRPTNHPTNRESRTATRIGGNGISYQVVGRPGSLMMGLSTSPAWPFVNRFTRARARASAHARTYATLYVRR